MCPTGCFSCQFSQGLSLLRRASAALPGIGSPPDPQSTHTVAREVDSGSHTDTIANKMPVASSPPAYDMQLAESLEELMDMDGFSGMGMTSFPIWARFSFL